MHEPLLILYGSQTGCAEDVALRIGREARRRHFRPEIMAIDSIEKTRLPNIEYVVFVVATTGQGEEPDNMKQFWRFLLKKSIPVDALDRMRFTVFGLGDSSYAKFNYPARKLYRRLLQLGAQCFYDRGEGDDQHYLGIDGTLDPWLGGLWSTLLGLHPRPEGYEPIPDTVRPEPTYRVQVQEGYASEPTAPAIHDDRDATTGNQDGPVPPRYGVPIPMRLTCNKRITSPEHFQDVRHVELVRDAARYPWALTYRPGDVATLTPRNLPDEVDSFLALMGWQDQADQPLTVTPHEAWVHLPVALRRPVTLRMLFTTHFDIYSVPRRSFFEMLAYFTTDEQETDKLREFCSAEGQDDLYAYSHRVRRTIVEVLGDFHSYRIPLDYLFDVFPDIRPRSFSIASSLARNLDGLQLTVAIVDYRTRMSTPRRGVCTKWLATLRPEADLTLLVTIKPGTMSLPASPATPLIMVGPGTGVAPMRSFIQERVEKQKAPDNVLFFGCRGKTRDYLYADEWADLAARGMLQVHAAFSRDQDRKVYVQELIRAQGEQLWPLLNERKAVIVVSGNANRMPEDVKAAFIDVVARWGDYSPQGAANYILLLEKTKRYQEECWY
ncbi:NAPDH-dependent diflavin reductase [Tieghemiomyces parasiticus]|uniref:NADPH-dependent diflavin oxidoreductase 1 n=1 Tax=Tieghemiomyces parasiticus TaxID=78921 RepID=A0A9W8AH18_9FUNG|nr:NAPDH-dependent diflavin reductase [Tieghemiomyces parasiticus]